MTPQKNALDALFDDIETDYKRNVSQVFKDGWMAHHLKRGRELSAALQAAQDDSQPATEADLAALDRDLAAKYGAAQVQAGHVPVSRKIVQSCLGRIEELRLVDLGALRDAENNGHQDRIVRARRELADTSELINNLNEALKYGYGDARKDASVVEVMLMRQVPADRAIPVGVQQVMKEIAEIADEYDRQIEKNGYADTPGGIEHKDDAFELIRKWRDLNVG